MKNFTITKQHLKLLKNMYVEWEDSEFGAPEIDPKRPYGNSAVLNDIHEILTGEVVGCIDSKREELTDEEQNKYYNLHREMETVLQICLCTQKFKTGKYSLDDEYNSLTWKLNKEK